MAIPTRSEFVETQTAVGQRGPVSQFMRERNVRSGSKADLSGWVAKNERQSEGRRALPSNINSRSVRQPRLEPFFRLLRIGRKRQADRVNVAHARRGLGAGDNAQLMRVK